MLLLLSSPGLGVFLFLSFCYLVCRGGTVSFYCKLDVKNDALINLADNLKTKGLLGALLLSLSLALSLSRARAPSDSDELDKNSRREIANQRRGEEERVEEGTDSQDGRPSNNVKKLSLV